MRADKVPDLLIKAFVILVLMLSATALFSLLQPPGAAQQEETLNFVQGDYVVQIIWLGVYGITIVLILPRLSQLIYFITRDKLLLLIVIIVLLSALWSVAPYITLRRSVALVGTTLFGTYLAMRYRPIELLRLLASALGLAALLSLIVALMLPSYGVDPDTSRGVSWVGIFPQKNELGRSMALGAVVFLLLAFDGHTHGNRTYRWVVWVGIGLSLALLFLSNAIGPLVITLALLPLLFLFYRGLRIPYPLNITFLMGVVCAIGSMVAWLLGHIESVFDVLGRESSLTGRTDIWFAVLEKIWQRPFLGYGFGAFWIGWQGESASVWLITDRLEGLHPKHAHNGLLDIWLDVGLLGVAALAVGFSRTFLRALSWANSTRTGEGLWPLVCLVFILLHQLVESSLKQNSLTWILYVYVTIVLSMGARRAVVGKTGYIEAKPRRGVQQRVVRSPP